MPYAIMKVTTSKDGVSTYKMLPRIYIEETDALFACRNLHSTPDIYHAVQKLIGV